MTGRVRWRRLLPGLVSAAVVAAVFGFALPRLAAYGDVLDVFHRLSWAGVSVLAVVGVWNIVTFAPPWVAALPGLGLRRALLMTQAATALASTLPGGEAVGIGLYVTMLRRWGYRRGAIAAAVAVIGALNLLVKVVFPLVAVALLLASGGNARPLVLVTGIAVGAAAAFVVAGALALRSDASTRALAGRLERPFARVRALLRREEGQGLAERLLHFRSETAGLLGRKWATLVLWTAIGHGAVFLVLLVALRTLGVSEAEVSTVDAFAAWALTRLLTAIPITPGGLGIVELGLAGGLVAAGADDADAVAAVLLYRLLTWLPPILLGGPSVLLWRRLEPAVTARR